MQWLAVSLTLALGLSVAWGQSGGTISGSVFDVSGEKVADVQIRAANRATGAVYHAASSPQGTYRLEPLPAGRYDLSVEAPGFNPYARKNIVVRAGQTLPLDIHLLDYQLNTLGDGREFRIDQVTPHATPSGPAPRTPEGKPDFTGVWYAQRTVDPGKPEPLPWAEKLIRERAANNFKDAPGARCLTRGITAAGALFPYELVQTPARLVMLFEDDIPSHRTVYLDGRGHTRDPNPDWMGHSIGRWDGDTLMIDTVGFNDKTWLDAQGHPHTEMLHVVERLRRPDLGHLEIEFTIEDPGAYARPWIIRRVADLDTTDEIGEYVCTEGERDVRHMVGK
ncbi:MAG TPA: carboxypeptidase-like regulatory domain-containing protein [Bryobacteraceae bacterium]|nr:carboxypeptidase-like regulatory domain-containing protein [Bryobacteraceae bacterium]